MSGSDSIIIIAECVLTGVAFGVGIWFLRKKQKLTQRLQAQNEQKRIRELDQQLVNPKQRMSSTPEKETLQPYDEKYSSKSGKDQNVRDDVQIELTIRSAVAVRKYLTPVDQPIHIGTDKGNELVVDSKYVSGHQCVLKRSGKDIMLQNLDLHREVFIVRSMVKKRLSGKPVRIRTKDKVYMGDVSIEIVFI